MAGLSKEAASPWIFYLKNAIHKEMPSGVAGRYEASKRRFLPAVQVIKGSSY